MMMVLCLLQDVVEGTMDLVPSITAVQGITVEEVTMEEEEEGSEEVAIAEDTAEGEVAGTIT